MPYAINFFNIVCILILYFDKIYLFIFNTEFLLRHIQVGCRRMEIDSITYTTKMHKTKTAFTGNIT